MLTLKQPEMHVIAGPNGAGKSTFYEHILSPSGVEFVNADLVAAELWPGQESTHAYEASGLANQRRADLIDERRSFATETVFSHESKIELLREAVQSGYLVALHIIIVPEHLAVSRVENRVEHGGHTVPEEKIRARYQRLWKHVAVGIGIAENAFVYDNSSIKHAYRLIAHYHYGQKIQTDKWPSWAPLELTEASD